MAIQYTDPATVTPPIKIATDVFNPINVDPFLKPDKTLATLEKKLQKATGNEAIEIQKQIDARQAELTAQYGSVGFGSGGYVIPNYAYSEASGAEYGDLLAQQKATQAALAGKMQLVPSGDGVYQAQYYGPQGQTGYVLDPETGKLVDQYEYGNKVTMAQLAGKAPKGANLKTFYDENGKQLTPSEAAQTAQGKSFAAAGWDIGFGAGNIGDGTPATTNLPFSGSASTTNLPFTGTASSTTLPFSGTATTTNLSTGVTTNPFAPGSDAAKAWNERKSAYDLLYSEFNKYGLATLVTPLKDLIQKGVSPSEFTIELRNSPQYQTRFAANAKRVQSGLAALNEAQYIGLEDAYQGIMRNYGLPEQYYARGDLGVQAGFEKFIGNDVSPAELEDRIQTAERRVRYANPEVGIALKTFYPDITNGDVLAYALDPKTALESLKRRITAAEVGSTAVQLGLTTNVTDAEYLARYGVTKAQAQQGYSTIAGGLQRGSQLASIYGEDPYTQTTAEREVFNVPGAIESKTARQKITGLEKATFGGQSGLSSSALARERAGGF